MGESALFGFARGLAPHSVLLLVNSWKWMQMSLNLQSQSTRKQNWRQTEALTWPGIAAAVRGCPWQRGSLRTTCVCSLAFPNLRENGPGLVTWQPDRPGTMGIQKPELLAELIINEPSLCPIQECWQGFDSLYLPGGGCSRSQVLMSPLDPGLPHSAQRAWYRPGQCPSTCMLSPPT